MNLLRIELHPRYHDFGFTYFLWFLYDLWTWVG